MGRTAVNRKEEDKLMKKYPKCMTMFMAPALVISFCACSSAPGTTKTDSETTVTTHS